MNHTTKRNLGQCFSVLRNEQLVPSYCFNSSTMKVFLPSRTVHFRSFPLLHRSSILSNKLSAKLISLHSKTFKIHASFSKSSKANHSINITKESSSMNSVRSAPKVRQKEDKIMSKSGSQQESTQTEIHTVITENNNIGLKRNISSHEIADENLNFVQKIYRRGYLANKSAMDKVFISFIIFYLAGQIWVYKRELVETSDIAIESQKAYQMSSKKILFLEEELTKCKRDLERVELKYKKIKEDLSNIDSLELNRISKQLRVRKDKLQKELGSLFK